MGAPDDPIPSHRQPSSRRSAVLAWCALLWAGSALANVGAPLRPLDPD